MTRAQNRVVPGWGCRVNESRFCGIFAGLKTNVAGLPRRWIKTTQDFRKKWRRILPKCCSSSLQRQKESASNFFQIQFLDGKNFCKDGCRWGWISVETGAGWKRNALSLCSCLAQKHVYITRRFLNVVHRTSDPSERAHWELKIGLFLEDGSNFGQIPPLLRPKTSGGARHGLGGLSFLIMPPSPRLQTLKRLLLFYVIGYLAYFHSASPTRPRSGSTIICE